MKKPRPSPPFRNRTDRPYSKVAHRRSDKSYQIRPNRWLIGLLAASVLIVMGTTLTFMLKWLTGASPTPTPSSTFSVKAPIASGTANSATTIPSILWTASPAPISIQTSSTPVQNPDMTSIPPDFHAMQQYMLKLINQDRQANGLSQLARDDIAARSATQHALEMARFGFLSHWNLDGYGPEYRYSLEGGLNAVYENVYKYRNSLSSSPNNNQDWLLLVEQAQKSLMESVGLRENILAPAHTQVGIGIAYEPNERWLVISQEFVDQYITLQPVPKRVSLGESVIISGFLGPQAKSPLIKLAFEPMPQPKSIEDLNNTEIYISPVQTLETIPVTPESNGTFVHTITLDGQKKPGLYHIQIWVETILGQVLAADIIIQVQ